MAELPEMIIVELERAGPGGEVRSDALAALLHSDHQKIVGAVKSLESLGGVISTKLETVRNKVRSVSAQSRI